MEDLREALKKFDVERSKKIHSVISQNAERILEFLKSRESKSAPLAAIRWAFSHLKGLDHYIDELEKLGYITYRTKRGDMSLIELREDPAEKTHFVVHEDFGPDGLQGLEDEPEDRHLKCKYPPADSIIEQIIDILHEFPRGTKIPHFYLKRRLIFEDLPLSARLYELERLGRILIVDDPELGACIQLLDE